MRAEKSLLPEVSRELADYGSECRDVFIYV